MRYRDIKDGISKGDRGDFYYGYQKDICNSGVINLNGFDLNTKVYHIHLTNGLVQDTLNLNQQIAFTRIDVDWYVPVKICVLRKLTLLAVGDSIFLNDCHNWGGVKKW